MKQETKGKPKNKRNLNINKSRPPAGHVNGSAPQRPLGGERREEEKEKGQRQEKEEKEKKRRKRMCLSLQVKTREGALVKRVIV